MCCAVFGRGWTVRLSAGAARSPFSCAFCLGCGSEEMSGLHPHPHPRLWSALFLLLAAVVVNQLYAFYEVSRERELPGYRGPSFPAGFPIRPFLEGYASLLRLPMMVWIAAAVLAQPLSASTFVFVASASSQSITAWILKPPGTA